MAEVVRSIAIDLHGEGVELDGRDVSDGDSGAAGERGLLPRLRAPDRCARPSLRCSAGL